MPVINIDHVKISAILSPLKISLSSDGLCSLVLKNKHNKIAVPVLLHLYFYPSIRLLVMKYFYSLMKTLILCLFA